jgi:SAM-dependent methyltransferase
VNNSSDDIEFWDSRYRTGRMPWDFGGVPNALPLWLASLPSTGHTLIPGCGSGYEVEAFHDAGWDVTAIDYAPAAVAAARATLGSLGDKVILGDFFAHDFGEKKFEVIYERTFLCSLPPERWPAYVRRIKDLLRPNGILAGFFLYGEESEPPPYLLSLKQARALFAGEFTLLNSRPVADSLPLFAGNERWQEWRSA